jgi:glycosyltransferase involved in cell wall biosynthesis
MEPLVTIGIPTYDRPELLARALGSAAKQTYPNVEVLVADNGSFSESVALVVASFKGVIPELTYVRHREDIGALKNFAYLLAAAKGRYFMWLADDDEVSENYVSSLVAMLESDPSAASAAGHWMLMEDEDHGRVVPASSYPQSSPLARALRFIWRSDDAFFYAVHRTDVLRQASFRGYRRPNRDVLWNWAYVYLLDVVLRGRILIAPDMTVLFINHSYPRKTYAIRRRSVREVIARAIRRVNVHVLYWEKCAGQLDPLSMPLVVTTSVLSLIYEGAIRNPTQALRRVGRSNRRPGSSNRVR